MKSRADIAGMLALAAAMGTVPGRSWDPGRKPDDFDVKPHQHLQEKARHLRQFEHKAALEAKRATFAFDHRTKAARRFMEINRGMSSAHLRTDAAVTLEQVKQSIATGDVEWAYILTVDLARDVRELERRGQLEGKMCGMCLRAGQPANG